MGSSPISRSTAPRPFPYRKRAGRCLSRRRGRLCGGLRQGSYPVKYLPEEDCRHHTDRLAAVRWAWCEIRLSWSGSSFLKTGCAGKRKIIPNGEKIIPNGPLALPIALCYTQIISDGDTVRTNTRLYRKKIFFSVIYNGRSSRKRRVCCFTDGKVQLREICARDRADTFRTTE